MNRQKNWRSLLTLLAIPLAIGSCAKNQVKVPTASENEACAAEDDCKTGLTCFEKICRKVCQSDNDCSTTQKCTDSVCIANNSAACITAENCATPGLCQIATGAQCVGGNCVYPQAKEGTSCSTGDACLVNETCSAEGLCTNGTPKDCSHAVASECIGDNTIRVFSGTGSCDKEQGCNYDYQEYPCEDCANNASQCWQCNNDSDCVHTWHECFTGSCQNGKCEYTFNGSKPCGFRCVEGNKYPGYGVCTEEGCQLDSVKTCDGYQCNPQLNNEGISTDCLTDCQNDNDCVETHHCEGSQCVAKLENGEGCNPNNNGEDCQGGTCKVPAGETTAICCKGDDCCKGDAQCGNGLGCNRDTFACEPDVSGLTDGAECSANNECRSKNCVDGHCCTSTCAQDDFCIENRTTTFSCANDQGICRTATIECGSFGCNTEKTGCNTSCSSNSDCIAGFFCNSNSQCEEKHSQGKTCGTIKLSSDGTGSTCETGNCVDGTCCGSKECGTCQSCSTGSCANIASGKTGKNCSDANHVCDGKGNCDLIQGQSCSESNQCISDYCVDDHCCENSCNTQDVCKDRVTTSYSCATGKCVKSTQNCENGCNEAGTACQGSCGKNSDCATGQYCNSSGKCVAKITTGQTCGSVKNSADGKKSSCASGNCVDGVCCGSTSCGTCQACNLNGKGTCSAVTNAVDDSCSGTKQCDATGNCDLINGQTCSAASACLSGNCIGGYCCSATSCTDSCSGNMLTKKSCASGTCAATGSATACAGNLKCGNNTACLTACTKDDQCVNGYYCSSGKCVTKKTQGSTCDSNNQCSSGYCVDGHCCDKSACGTCQTCQTGSCVNVVDGQNDSDTCNGSTQQCKSGSCVKKQGQSCSAASDCYTPYCTNSHCCTTSSCSAADCSDETHRRTYSCGSSGICAANTPTACGTGYKCISGTCKTNCSSSNDCASGYYCSTAGTCVAKLADSTSSSNKICSKEMLKLQTEGAGTVCKSGRCSGDGYCYTGSEECPKAQCTSTNDGFHLYSGVTGTCEVSNRGQRCMGYVCADGACKTSCSASSDCLSGWECAGGRVCKVKQGGSCVSDSVCYTGHCVDNVCCNTSCAKNQTCSNSLISWYQCNLSGSIGTCTQTSGSCGDYKCDNTTSCKTTCSSDLDCNNNYTCMGGYCLELTKLGKSCSNKTDCHPDGKTYPEMRCSGNSFYKDNTCLIEPTQSNTSLSNYGCSRDIDCIGGGNSRITCDDGHCYPHG